MRLRIHHPLFAGFLGVIGLLVVLVVVLVGSSLRRELQEGVRSEMERLLALGEAIVSSSTGADPHALARTIANRIGRRVTIVAGDGRVLGDSHVHPDDVPAIEPHGDRPEVAAVLAGERAVAFSERP
ncbi:MAG TPA: hypothetical protein VFQ22_00800, partial [Longimicrobiales bacterium]|nr:hypothetical protein [Longimicrobiales bacterium]